VLEDLQAVRLATVEFGRRLDAVAMNGWDAPSPCVEWTVRDVCDHVVGGNRFAVLVLSGMDWRSALETVQGSDFSGDPRAAFAESGERQIAAFEAQGVLGRTVSHPAGSMLGRDFARHRVLDLVVHGWDVARGSGGDERIELELAEVALRVLSGDGAEVEGGFFGAGPSGTVGPQAPVQQRLLDLSGRRP
jgi:uncharacterized protein (TIGR03086 family)